jgi:hypothetical protein
MKIKQRARDKYEWYFSMCRIDEPRPLSQIPFDANGLSAVECFHAIESTGTSPSCREPILLEKYIQGKVWHGVTVETISNSLVEGLVADFELNEYPLWVKNEIIKQGSKISLNTIEFIPSFVLNGILTNK